MKDKLAPPLTLYIHLPWCVRKCPYCDFNSHELKQDLPEEGYVTALLEDLRQDLESVEGRALSAIFIGGGTPSLFSPRAIERLLSGVQGLIGFEQGIEITLEANPGTVEQQRFTGFRQAGVNRLSIGVQSFDDAQLKRLGRIHDSAAAERAIEAARLAGFDNFNIDIMFGLPEQSEPEALSDLERAMSHNPRHLSWYQLTIEPNTLFHHRPPVLPVDDDIWGMQLSGQALLAERGYQQYEISAYSQPDFQCQHNRNYWEFGDYLGIGAGAHAKITDLVSAKVTRTWKTRHPKFYLDRGVAYIQGTQELKESDLVLEFMLNALRLVEPIQLSLFTQRTGISTAVLDSSLAAAQEKGLLVVSGECIETTPLGKQHLNELLLIFS
jgi:putative oxygen-independent coproporphyrinogen III oxidase